MDFFCECAKDHSEVVFANNNNNKMVEGVEEILTENFMGNRKISRVMMMIDY